MDRAILHNGFTSSNIQHTITIYETLEGSGLLKALSLQHLAEGREEKQE
jgi:hypothetical protein